MALTGKQRSYLRGLGPKLPAAVRIGKEGLSPGLIETVRRRLERCELIQVRLGEAQGAQRQAQAAELAAAAGAELAGVVGRTALLYRPNERLDEAERIRVP